jgi:hypothetical protein
MSTTGLLLLLTILILSTASSLYTIDRAQAVESNCDDEILSLLSCSLGSESGGSSIIASARTAQEYTENATLGIVVDASGGSEVIDVNNDDNNDDEDNVNANIESQIPSTISAIPFP